MTAPTIAPIAFPSPALTFAAASGCCAIACSTIASSSPESLAPRSRRSTISAGLAALADEHRQDLAGAAAVDLLGGDETDERRHRLRGRAASRPGSSSASRASATRSPVTQLAIAFASTPSPAAAVADSKNVGEIGVEGEQLGGVRG